MLDPKLKQKWIKALWSGNYLRGTGQLRKMHNDKLRHCCLGVLCDMVNPKLWGEDHTYDGDIYVLPSNLQTEIGLTNSDVKILMRMNDLPKGNFKTIARWIAKNL